jgi:UDP-N-acetylglucosamine 4-epimerase
VEQDLSVLIFVSIFYLKDMKLCLDNFATGHKHNLKDFVNNPNFRLIEGDIRSTVDCQNAVKDVDYVLHQAALGSVPRSINDPVATNEVNVSGF